MTDFKFTLWDVEHGLSLWIQTPAGQNHCIDVGMNTDTNFCPYKHMHYEYGVNKLDYLIISHPDKDHIEGLPYLIEYLGEPKVFLRNKSFTATMRNDDCTADYLRIFHKLDMNYTARVKDSENPCNHLVNGGVRIESFYNSYSDGMKSNNTSIVSFYKYKGFLFIMPGDIEPDGWELLYRDKGDNINDIVENSNSRVLIAPHHGRPSAYCKDMVDTFSPNIILISDKYAKHETAQQYYSAGSGINIGNNIVRCLSTKTKGRIQIAINEHGKYSFL